MNHDQLSAGLVNQVFMGYGSSGMCALASSFEDSELHTRWEQFLMPYARLQPLGEINPPPVAFTYVTVDDGSAAILRRVREGDSTGRNNGHALVGPASLLGPLALRLTHTFRWAVRPDEMGRDPYEVEQLREMKSSPDGVALLDDEGDSDRCVDSVSRIAGWMLAHPRLNVSAIGLDHHLIIPTLELFEVVLRPLFADLPTRSWSFSTYEEGDADPGPSFRLPELIFLPALPSHAGETRHHRLFLDENADADDQYHELAKRLVDECRQLGHDEYSSKMKDELSLTKTIESRIRYLLGDESRAPRGDHPIQDELDQAPQESLQIGGRSEFGEWSPAVSSPSPEVAPMPPSASSIPSTANPEISEPSQSVKEPAGEVSRTALNDDDLILQLAKASTRSEVNMKINLLREHACPIPDKNRWHLISRPPVLNSIACVLHPWELPAVYTRLLEFAFGVDAKALRQQEYFNWVKNDIRKSGANYFFGHTIFFLVEGSPVAAECHNLLRERWQQALSIPLMAPDDTDRRVRLPHLVRGGSGLLELCRNRQLLIVVILVILMASIITMAVILT